MFIKRELGSGKGMETCMSAPAVSPMQPVPIPERTNDF